MGQLARESSMHFSCNFYAEGDYRIMQYESLNAVLVTHKETADVTYSFRRFLLQILSWIVKGAIGLLKLNFIVCACQISF